MMITKIFEREKRQRKKERQASHRWDGDSLNNPDKKNKNNNNNNN